MDSPPPYSLTEDHDYQTIITVPVLCKPLVPSWDASPTEVRRFLALFWLHKSCGSNVENIEEATKQALKLPAHGRFIHTLSKEYLLEVWDLVGGDLHDTLYQSRWGYVC